MKFQKGDRVIDVRDGLRGIIVGTRDNWRNEPCALVMFGDRVWLSLIELYHLSLDDNVTITPPPSGPYGPVLEN